MKMICIQCQSEMIKDCKVSVEGDLAGIKISQKHKGIFNSVTAKTKASVCPNCGYVAFYIDDYKKFSE